VRPDNYCNYAICNACTRFDSTAKRLASQALQLRYIVARLGAWSLLGLIMVTVVQSMYLPAVRSAAATIFCHSDVLVMRPYTYITYLP
jgi:hypothetical protein